MRSGPKEAAPPPSLPHRAIRMVVPLFGTVVRPIQLFFRLEAASGLVLLVSALIALAWVNLGGGDGYRSFVHLPIFFGIGELSIRFSLHQLVNDGLMTIFFFLVGMEIKRELVLGELSTLSSALLPAVAALGGMLVPAGLFLAFNWSGPGRAGWGIPMATDIAFCVGVLTLLRARVPRGLIVFVTALAIFDDIGGILVIALFYGEGLSTAWLLAAGAVVSALVFMSRENVRSGVAYAVVGAALWYAFLQAGIHPTIAGVILGSVIPARPRRPLRETLSQLADHTRAVLRNPTDDELDGEAVVGMRETLQQLEAPLTDFVHRLHPFVAFGIVPLFALVNSGVEVRGLEPALLLGPLALGTGLALWLGKMLGIFAFTSVAVKLGLAPMPGHASYVKLLGVSTVAGIGFTVALFINELAFPGRAELIDQAKVGILAGSLVAGLSGALLLRFTSRIAHERPVRGDPLLAPRVTTSATASCASRRSDL